MRHLIDAARARCATQNWYSALYLCLTLPDICVKMETPGSSGPGEKYRAWFDTYAKPKYQNEFFGPDFAFITGADCWGLRCSILHEGRDVVAKKLTTDALSRFSFTSRNTHLIKIGDVLVVNVSKFVDEMTSAVEAWLVVVQDNAEVQARISEMAIVRSEPFNPIPGVRVG